MDKEFNKQQAGKNIAAKVVRQDSQAKERQQQQDIKKNPSIQVKDTNIPRWRYYVPLAIVLLLSFIVYLPVLQNGFVWDDVAYIKENPLIYSINLKEIFSKYVVGNYHPFTILILAAEYHFFELDATGYHAVNLLLHLLNVILVFYVVFLLSDKPGVALVTALLFGIHPMHVESVAWAAELKDLLYTFFFLASYIFYLKYLTNGHKRFYFFALLLFSISLLSKAMAASLPVVMMLTDYFQGRKIHFKTLLEKVPFFLLAIVFGIVAILAQKSASAIQDLTVLTFPQRLVFASYGFITYLWKLFVPFHLSAFYPYPIKNGESIPLQFYIYLILFTGFVAFVLYSFRFSKKIFFSIGFFAITVFFVLQLLPVGAAIMADRYSYIPSIGIFYLAGEGFLLLWNKKFKLLPIIILSAFTVFFSVKTYARCGIWKSEMTLWNDVIYQDQTVWLAYYNRGNSFRDGGKYDLAIGDYSKAIELDPRYTEAYVNRGNVLRDNNRSDEALKDYNKAIELKPDFYKAYFNRGTLFMNNKRDNEALKDFNKAIELKPDYVESYIHCGNVFYNGKRFEDAIKNYSKAIEIKADNAIAFYSRGWAEYNSGKKDAACSDMKKAASLGYKPAADALSQICK